MSGLKLAALYGIKPHQLGFCGPEDKGVLLEYLRGKRISEKKVRKILEGFKGAYPYYELIAKSNNIKDPFDERVVRAYWVGNRLLEKDPKLYHCYHVLVVGSVTGRIKLEGKLKDLCRIGWGEVAKLKVKSLPARAFGSGRWQAGQKLKVIYKPLLVEQRLKLGKPVEKEIDWDKSLVPDVKIGDWVSFHWNQTVEVLTEKDVKNLEKYTRITLKSLWR